MFVRPALQEATPMFVDMQNEFAPVCINDLFGM